MNKPELTFYFALFSHSSRNGLGLKPRVDWLSEAKIVEWAASEMVPGGESFEDMAGIPMVERENGDLEYERRLERGDLLTLSIIRLNTDGRLFRMWPADDAGASSFVSEAEKYGLADDARHVVSRLFDNLR